MFRWPFQPADVREVRFSFSAGLRSRGAVTVIGTLAVVVAEFLLLTLAYQRAEPASQQMTLAAVLDGEWTTVSPANLDAVRADTRQQLVRLGHVGVADRYLSAIQTTADATSVAHGVVVGRARVSAAIQSLTQEINTEKRTVKNETEGFYAILLITASLGWMIWFRRLVARHRALEHELTEQQSRSEGEQRLAALVRNAADVMLLCDLDGRIGFVTPSARAVLGLEADLLIGQRVIDLVLPDDSALIQRVLTTVPDREDRPLRVRMHHADGRPIYVEGTVSNLLADPAVSGIVVTFRDVTARVELEAQLSHQAFHDSLTGLANRQLFTDRLKHALSRRNGDQRPLVVLFCDLDEFKNVNDSLGHGIGDQVLQEISLRAAASIRQGDTVARLGGDEFAVLLEDTDLDEGHQVATRLLDAVSQPIALGDTVLLPRISIGIAVATPGSCTSEDALRNADVAMYMAKDRGKGTIAIYDATLHAEALDRLAIRAELQRAIRDHELVLHFQPIVDLATGHIASFEALVRWDHPQRGLIPPSVFIPIAEQTGLIHALGSWVLRSACRAASELFANQYGLERSMSVNVASQQLGRDDFVSEVFAVLASTGLLPHQLTLEITESALLNDMDIIVDRLSTLRRAGIRIAIDDFGTGYNSLAYLRNLPIDVLKVDKAFIDHVATNEQDAALTHAILQMSASMNLITVAEGVEHSEQAGWLTQSNCLRGQTRTLGPSPRTARSRRPPTRRGLIRQSW